MRPEVDQTSVKIVLKVSIAHKDHLNQLSVKMDSVQQRVLHPHYA